MNHVTLNPRGVIKDWWFGTTLMNNKNQMKQSSNNNSTQVLSSTNWNYLLKNAQYKIFVLAIFLVCLFIFKPLKAQITFKVNTASQTLWGPVGYNYVNYYYLPEADVFYSVPENKFFYPEGNKWVAVNTLPPKYNVDLFNTYKVVVNKPKPYLNHGYYVSNYAKYKKGGPKQVLIRESDDNRYYIIKNHPKHSFYKVEKEEKENRKHEDGDKKEKHSSNTKHHGKKDDK